MKRTTMAANASPVGAYQSGLLRAGRGGLAPVGLLSKLPLSIVITNLLGGPPLPYVAPNSQIERLVCHAGQRAENWGDGLMPPFREPGYRGRASKLFTNHHVGRAGADSGWQAEAPRSEEHTSELQ